MRPGTRVYIKDKAHPWYDSVATVLAVQNFPLTLKPGLLLELPDGHKFYASPDSVVETGELPREPK